MDETQFKDLIKQSPFQESPVTPTMLSGDKVIQFRCHRDVKCWNACCANIDIQLTPYDILRLKNRLDLSSGEFLQKYSVPFEMDKDGMPGVKLRPVENGTACQFMTPEGCGVYEDRPTACRYYPVALLSMRNQNEITDRTSYAMVEEPHCLGHQEPRQLTIEEYRQEQGVDNYDEKGRGWRQLVLKRKSAGPGIGKPPEISNQLFFMASYDVDRFRAFIASESFNRTYDVPLDAMTALLSDDEALMDFGYNFLKHVLFNERFLEERDGAYETRMERLKIKAEQVRDEYLANRDKLEDDKYSDTPRAGDCACGDKE
ncbi:MAG: YkgJ family cysteine cluster protein [Pseudomonadota bacterium]|nr:YkgJ family cysteine cluster protein [Pseudomonadota bacterium]